MISTQEALDKVLALCDPIGTEDVDLANAAGRILVRDAIAGLDQPPFSSSAMDGYAVRQDEVREGAAFDVIGEAAAGRAFEGVVGAGQAARIFTGAPLPQGADYVVIQEDVERDGDLIRLSSGFSKGPHVRPAGGDFRAGDRLSAPRRLSITEIALLAAMNVPRVTVRRRPHVALVSTGDELVMPGETPGRSQIICSNAFGLKAMIEAHGGTADILPIARDTEDDIRAVLERAQSADLIVTTGGASVGDHDLVGKVSADMGLERAFYKVAMRPGKPLMAGRLGKTRLIGLPGNPVSALVTGRLFVVPALNALLGLEAGPARRLTAELASDLDPNGPREHYMRAIVKDGQIRAFDRQDSSLMSILSRANALLVRPPFDNARTVGETVEYVPL